MNKSRLMALTATKVPHDVYKYVGQPKKVEGMLIEPGTLVYLDPASKQRNSYHFKVRLLQGVNQSWQKVVAISRDALQLVEKVVNEGLDAIEGHQGDLLDGSC
jgi:hypothetical protein